MERKALLYPHPVTGVGGWGKVLVSEHEVSEFWNSVHVLSLYYGEDLLLPMH